MALRRGQIQRRSRRRRWLPGRGTSSSSKRTQLINALRGHLAEHGLIAAAGPAHVNGCWPVPRVGAARVNTKRAATDDPRVLRNLQVDPWLHPVIRAPSRHCRVSRRSVDRAGAPLSRADRTASRQDRGSSTKVEARSGAGQEETARTCMTMPGRGPADCRWRSRPSPRGGEGANGDVSKGGRELAAWTGLVPVQRSDRRRSSPGPIRPRWGMRRHTGPRSVQSRISRPDT